MKVKVYLNLRKKLFSIMQDEGALKGKVIQHLEEVFLEDVTYKVSPAGRARVLESRQKNVHAFVCGTLRTTEESASRVYSGLLTTVRYNPYETETFVDSEGAAIVKSYVALLTCKHGSPMIYAVV